MEISLIVPAYNEEDCIEATLREAHAALLNSGISFEIMAVNDGSKDGTLNILKKLARELSGVRVFSIAPNSGQSAAFAAGFKNSRGKYVVLMDGDGQNDPCDIPALVKELEGCDVCCGYRANRRDTQSRVLGSKMANIIRRLILKDGIIDTGCSLKAFRADVVRDLPMFHGMHRFLPALAIMKGARIKQVPVNHRNRSAGKSKYTNAGRLAKTIFDLWAVRWMQKRFKRYSVIEEEVSNA